MDLFLELNLEWAVAVIFCLVPLFPAFVANSSAALPTNSILFVTQVPVPKEINHNAIVGQFTGIAAPFGNHRGEPEFCARGGDLWIRYGNGNVSNLTRNAGFGTVTGFQGTNSISVRDPFVHWSGTKAVFSMVVGAPTNAADSLTQHNFWQLYEVTNLDIGQTPIISIVPNQPTNFNNVMPCYGTDDRIIFVSDRPRNGSQHLWPQLDEYLDSPITSGLWSLDPTDGDLFLMSHAPSGAFGPFVDSFGRVIFTRWDHLARDKQAVYDSFGQTTNGTFNYSDESSNATYTLVTPTDTYPEPRNFDTNATAAAGVNGNAFNQFFPWEINEDGTSEEIVNHAGRHELVQIINKSYTNDANLTNLVLMTGRFGTNLNPIGNFFQIAEDPLHSGDYFAVDTIDISTHTAGQIVKLAGAPTINPEQMTITYLTPRVTAGPTNGLSAGQAALHTGFYRNPVPMPDGTMVAAHTTNRAIVVNLGDETHPKSAYDFRIKTLVLTNGFYTPGTILTPGFTSSVSYFAAGQSISYTGALWEIDPAVVMSKTRPVSRQSAIRSTEHSVFDEEGVDIPTFQSYLRTNNLALIVSRNVTTRDRNDRQQPFNLHVPGGTQTVATAGKVYDISYLQLFQADQLRGVTLDTTNPLPGRRVLPTLLHDAPLPPVTGAPPSSVKLGMDGSFAAFVPASRAMTWHLIDTNNFSVVKERYWLTFAPGEIRTCTSCHGLNTADQLGRPAPTNQPLALRDLLRYWKGITKYSRIVSSTTASNGDVNLQVSGVPVYTNIVMASPDLVSWDDIATNSTSTNGIFQVTDPATGSQTQRFYRVLVP